MTREEELESTIEQFKTSMAELDILILRLREVTGTIGLLVLAIRRLVKKP